MNLTTTTDLTTFNGLWSVFWLPILMSLIGAVIGHYANNGVIQFPAIAIIYEKPHYLEGATECHLKFARKIIIVLHFISFIIGFRFRESDLGNYIYIDMGFLGDLLVGIGTGILAKTAVALSGANSDFAVISSSLLAGYAGLSYFKKKDDKDLQAKVDWQRISNNGSVNQNGDSTEQTDDDTIESTEGQP
jgi:hypothetical protein